MLLILFILHLYGFSGRDGFRRLEYRCQCCDEACEQRLVVAHRDVRYRHPRRRHRRCHGISKDWRFLVELRHLVHESPFQSFSCCQPSTLTHKIQESLLLLAAFPCVHAGHVVVQFVQVTDGRLAVVAHLCELVCVQRAPLKEFRAAFVHQVHCR